MAVNTGTVGLVNTPVYIPSKLNLTLGINETLEDFLQRALFIIETVPSQVIRNAGEEVVLIIKTLQEAYKQSATLTVNQADHVLKARISQLDLVIRNMEERNVPELNKILTSALQQAIAGSIFATNNPYVRSISPSSIVTSQVHEFVIEFFGNFPQAADRDFQPQLTLNGHQATIFENYNAKLSFRIATAIAFKQNNVASGMLCIPYSAFVSFNRGLMKYQFEVCALPKTVGTINIESFRKEASPPVHIRKESPLFKLNSRKRYGGKDLQQLCKLEVTSGRKMVHGSQGITWIKQSGRREFAPAEVNEKGVSYRAATFNHSKDKRSGKLYFSIFFMEYDLPDPTLVPTVTPVELEWGASKIVEFPPRSWKLIFNPFDNFPPKEFADSNYDDPYIKIEVDGPKIRLSTVDATKIKHPLSARQLNIIHTQPSQLVTNLVTQKKLPLLLTFSAGFASGYFLRSKL